MLELLSLVRRFFSSFFFSLRHFCDMPYAYTSNSHVGTLQEGMGCAQRGEGRQMKIFKLPSLSEITYLEIHSQFRSEVLVTPVLAALLRGSCVSFVWGLLYKLGICKLKVMPLLPH